MSVLANHDSTVPVYKLYGERQQWPMPDLFHCERIADRSKLHNWRINWHQHHSLVQLLYLEGGSAKVGLDGRYINLAPGHIVQVPSMCVHGFQFDRDAQGYVLTLATPLSKRLVQAIDPAGTLLDTPHVYPVDDNQQAAGGLAVNLAFARLHAEYGSAHPHRTIMIEALLTSILVWLSRCGARPAAGELAGLDRGRQHFQRFTELIEKHYTEQLPVAAYARRLGITAAHLNALCRQIVGQSALELIHQRIVLAAKRSLVYTSMTISVIADTLGFADPAYFARFFKRETGVSPRQFRKDAATLLEAQHL